MVTVKADNRRRVQLPDVKPGQIFALQDNGDGSLTLTKVKAERQEAFPPGSLAYLCTPERDAEMSEIARAFVIGVQKDHYEKE